MNHFSWQGHDEFNVAGQYRDAALKVCYQFGGIRLHASRAASDEVQLKCMGCISFESPLTDVSYRSG
jgi:hypothetical protein